jgi:DNA polymerase-1
LTIQNDNTKQKVVLIDGNSIAYRAFFALPLLSNKQGQFTNAVYGFTMMLLRLLEEEKPTHIAVAFDAGKINFRHEMYAAYKGTREKTPGELSGQFPLLRELLVAFGIAAIELPGYEADDIIGTISHRTDTMRIPTLVVSGDKDLLQLVSADVHALLPRKGLTEAERYDPETIRQRYGLTPEQIIDLKGLMGDTSDNIPGIPGVGEKTALKLLHEFGSVEEVLAHADQVSGKKLQEKLKEFADQARLSKQLATIQRDIPLEWNLEQLEFAGFDVQKIKGLFQSLEFKSLLDKLPQHVFARNGVEQDSAEASITETEVETTPSISVRIIHAEQELAEFLQTIETDLACVSDVQVTASSGNMRGIALSNGREAVYVPLQDGTIPQRLVDLFIDDRILKVSYDVKTLMVHLARQGMEIGEKWFDVLLGSYLLNPSEGQPELVEILNRDLHRQLEIPSWLNGKGKGAEASEDVVAQWFGMLAAGVYQERPVLEAELKTHDLDRLYHDLELPLTFVLGKMESIGVKVDEQRLQDIGKHLEERLQELQSEIYRLAGTTFNINSPKQLGEILFDKLGLPTQKKTKTGYSTSADVLEKLAPYHEIVQNILDYRQLGKLQSTYVEGLLKVIDPVTGKVHTRFNQATTATGRLSSTDPNLQNIPIRMEEGRKLRQAFIPSESGWFIVSADYSQIELRIMAHLSEDETMIDAFLHDLDIHTRTASDVFNVPMEEVTPLMRRTAKAVNFGIIYGISDYGLSQNLNISRAQAGEFIQNYFAKFPGVKRFIDQIVAKAREDGYVTTLLNRRRYLPDIRSSNFNLRSFAERTAMNTPIQGTAADIIKLAMVRIDSALREVNMRARMLLQVHDELIFECPPDELDALQALVRDKMENALSLRVPLKVDIHYGPTWYEAK